MRSIEKTGKTIEEAVQAGLSELGLERFEVTVEVLDEGSKGFFGLFGSKPARVRVTEREHMPDIDMDQILRPGASTRVSTIADKPRAPRQAKPAPRPERTPRTEPKPERAQRSEPKPKPERAPHAEPKPEAKPERAQRSEPKPKPKPERTPRTEPKPEAKPERTPRTEPKPRTEAKRETRPERAPRTEPKPERAPHAEPKRPAVALPDGPLPEQDVAALSEVGRRAYEYLDKLTRLMGVPVKIYVAEAESVLSISMMGDTLGILIGRRGDTLDALQYLTSLEVNKDRSDYLRVSLDTEHYRAKREESLARLAERMAARAVKTGRKVVLEPMNPYERRVLHSTLQSHPDVQTHSEGDEPNRRVVITLRRPVQSEAGEAPRERKPARKAPGGERKDRPQREPRHEAEGARKPRPPRPPRPARQEQVPENGVEQPSLPVITAQDVPSDPTDDTI